MYSISSYTVSIKRRQMCFMVYVIKCFVRIGKNDTNWGFSKLRACAVDRARSSSYCTLILLSRCGSCSRSIMSGRCGLIQSTAPPASSRASCVASSPPDSCGGSTRRQPCPAVTFDLTRVSLVVN